MSWPPSRGHRAMWWSSFGRCTVRACSAIEARLCDCGQDGYEEKAAAVRRLDLELLKAERQTVVDLRDREVINDDVLRDIERDIDLEELRVKEDDLDNDDRE